MKFYVTGQEEGDLLIKVTMTASAGLTVCECGKGGPFYFQLNSPCSL